MTSSKVSWFQARTLATFPIYLITGPSSSRCRKRTRGRSRPRSLWMKVKASWMSTAGTSMKTMVKLIQITSSVRWYMLQSTAAVMNSAQYSTVANTTLKGGRARLWLTTSMTPFSATEEHCSTSEISPSCSSMATSHIVILMLTPRSAWTQSATLIGTCLQNISFDALSLQTFLITYNLTIRLQAFTHPRLHPEAFVFWFPVVVVVLSCVSVSPRLAKWKSPHRPFVQRQCAGLAKFSPVIHPCLTITPTGRRSSKLGGDLKRPDARSCSWLNREDLAPGWRCFECLRVGVWLLSGHVFSVSCNSCVKSGRNSERHRKWWVAAFKISKTSSLKVRSGYR